MTFDDNGELVPIRPPATCVACGRMPCDGADARNVAILVDTLSALGVQVAAVKHATDNAGFVVFAPGGRWALIAYDAMKRPWRAAVLVARDLRHPAAPWSLQCPEWASVAL